MDKYKIEEGTEIAEIEFCKIGLNRINDLIVNKYNFKKLSKKSFKKLDRKFVKLFKQIEDLEKYVDAIYR